MKDRREERAAYFTALGEFIHEFAQTERALQIAIWSSSGVKPKLGQALFGRLQVGEASDLIKKLRAAKQAPANAELDRALKQLKIVADTRNKIVHRGADFTSTGPAIAKSIFAMTDASEIPISPTHLNDLWADLRTIQSAIIVLILEQVPIDPDQKDVWLRAARAPWRYKQP